MELDDQLAALAAGELDDDTARALRARAAADPALGRRLARHRRLQDLLATWAAPPLADEANARLDAAIEAALADLDDGPLAEAATPRGPLATVPDATHREHTPSVIGTPADDVIDLGAARDQRRAPPPWLSGAAVAAALLAVVGVGVTVGGGGIGGFGGDDSADVVADSATDEGAEAGMAESDMADDAADEEAAALAPTTPGDLDIGEGDLLVLLDDASQAGTAAEGEADEMVQSDGAGSADDAAEDQDAVTAPDACVVEALERDTVGGDDGQVVRLAVGTYDGAPAQFVVVRTPQDGGGDRYDVLAYKPVDCTLLDRDDAVR